MPLGGRDVGHRLDGLVLRRQARGEGLGVGAHLVEALDQRIGIPAGGGSGGHRRGASSAPRDGAPAARNGMPTAGRRRPARCRLTAGSDARHPSAVLVRLCSHVAGACQPRRQAACRGRRRTAMRVSIREARPHASPHSPRLSSRWHSTPVAVCGRARPHRRTSAHAGSTWRPIAECRAASIVPSAARRVVEVAGGEHRARVRHEHGGVVAAARAVVGHEAEHGRVVDEDVRRTGATSAPRTPPRGRAPGRSASARASPARDASGGRRSAACGAGHGEDHGVERVAVDRPSRRRRLVAPPARRRAGGPPAAGRRRGPRRGCAGPLAAA